MPDADRHLMTIFAAALDRASEADRAAYLDEVCGSDSALRGRIEALLRAHAGAGQFLGPAPAEPTPTGTFAAPTAGAAGPAAGDMVGGRYKLLERAGEGAMGEVWAAEQTEPVRRRVAVKLIRPGMDSKAVLARFEAERQALALMDHPHIAKVLDGGATAAGRPFFVMELVKGLPITRYCDDHRLNPRQRLELFADVCAAVQHAHQKGVIHRDIKPSNVLVAPYDGRPVVKVIDFGIAKATGQPLTDKTLFTKLGAIVGTPEYMSPEQAELNNADIDTRSDLYSLGVLLYELLTGTTPLTRQRVKEAALLEVLRVVREEEPPKPSTRLSELSSHHAPRDEPGLVSRSETATLASIAATRGLDPKQLTGLVRGELDWIVMKALEKDRNRRYATANGLAEDVRRFLADEPVAAGPPSAVYRLRKFVRRNRGPVLAAALVLLALVAGVVGTSGGLIWAEYQRRAAVASAARATRAQERADQGFARATGAVEQYLKAVTEDPDLKYKHDMHPLRKKLVNAAVPFYQWFAEQKPDEPAWEAERGHAYHRLATVRQELGEQLAAIHDFEQARTIFALLVADFPAEPKFRRALSLSHNHLGVLRSDLGQWQAAEQDYRRAVEIQERLVADFPSEPTYRLDLGASQGNLAGLLADTGQHPAAEQAYRRCIEFEEKLVGEFPANPEYRRSLAVSLLNLGRLQRDQSRWPAAAQSYGDALKILQPLAADHPAMPTYSRELANCHNQLGLLASASQSGPPEPHYLRALEIQEKLADNFPSLPQYRLELAGSYVNFGDHLANQGKAEASLDWFARAITLLAPLVRKEPRLVNERLFLRNAHGARADALTRLARHREALKDWDEVLALNTDPKAQVSLRIQRASCLVRAGEYARAAAEADALAGAEDVTGAGLVDLACVFALTAAGDEAPQRERAAGRAVELLRRALDNGFTDVARLKEDLDLDLLRARADFKALLADPRLKGPAPK